MKKTMISLREIIVGSFGSNHDIWPGIPSLPFSAFFEEKGWKRMKREHYFEKDSNKMKV